MNSSAISSLQSPLSDYRTALQTEQQEGQTAAVSDLASSVASSTQTDSVNISAQAQSQNMMSRNFAGGKETDSKYVDATLAGIKASKQMAASKQSAMTSILSAAQTAYGNAATTGEKAQALSRAEQMINLSQSKEVRKSAEESHLKESQERIEQKAQEAAAPKDENGNPIETVSSGTGQAAPMPEISGSNPAPAAATAPAAAAPSAASSPAPDVSVDAGGGVAAAPSVSVDVTV